MNNREYRYHHDHGHDHDHDHEHGHSHDHSHSHGPSGGDQTTAVLGYMLEHNQHHAEELVQLAQKLAAAGQENGAELLRQGVADFNAGNGKIEAALKLLKGE